MGTLAAGLTETGAEMLINGIPAALSHIRERKQGAEKPFQDAFVRYPRNAARFAACKAGNATEILTTVGGGYRRERNAL